MSPPYPPTLIFNFGGKLKKGVVYNLLNLTTLKRTSFLNIGFFSLNIGLYLLEGSLPTNT